jgi:hypothetical protein
MLDGCAGELVADARGHRFAYPAIVAEDTDLDQLVRLQRQVDFAQHRGGQTLLADRDDRVQVVRLRAKVAALRGREQHGGQVSLFRTAARTTRSLQIG